MYFSAGGEGTPFVRRGTVIESDEVRLVNVVAMPSGRLASYYVKWRPEDGRYDHHVVFSDDGGETWSSPGAPVDSDHPSRQNIPKGDLAAGPSGHLHVAYVRQDGGLYAYHSGDGETWTARIIQPDVVNTGPALAVRDDGAIGVAWDESHGLPSEVWINKPESGKESATAQ